jgi:hypothetical protein
MEEKDFSYEDSIKLIDAMIKKAKKSYVTKGIASIVWGILIIVCSLITWAKIQFSFNIGFDIWVLVFFAIFPQIFFSIKEKRQRKFTSLEAHAINYVWMAFGISIFLFTYYNSKYGTAESGTIFMILYGVPTFITGAIVKFKPMLFGGIICWIISIISVSTPVNIDMLLMASCGLFAWLIPGIILFSRYQKRKIQQDGV